MPEDGKNELHLLPVCVVEFYVGVTRCPDRGVSGGLNNRGHDDWPEITCWPKKVYHSQTTGREFKELQISLPTPNLNPTEKKMCAILGLKEWELHTFLRNWQPYKSNDKYPTTVEEVSEKMHQVSIPKVQRRKWDVIPMRVFKREHGL